VPRSASADVAQVPPGAGESWWKWLASLLAGLLGLLTAAGYRRRAWIGAALASGLLRARLGLAALGFALLALPLRFRLGLGALAVALTTLPARARLAIPALLAVLATLPSRVRLALASLMAMLVAVLMTIPTWWRR
jgi:hypothetical protein